MEPSDHPMDILLRAADDPAQERAATMLCLGYALGVLTRVKADLSPMLLNMDDLALDIDRARDGLLKVARTIREQGHGDTRMVDEPHFKVDE